jgi:hypothetical protein
VAQAQHRHRAHQARPSPAERPPRAHAPHLTRPPGANSPQQQDRFDRFVEEFNRERPHEAIAMRCPAGIWLVTFIDYDLGYIDLEQRTLQTIDNPFGPRVSPMS